LHAENCLNHSAQDACELAEVEHFVMLPGLFAAAAWTLLCRPCRMLMDAQQQMDNLHTLYSPSLICLPRHHCPDQTQPQTFCQQQQPPQSDYTGIVLSMLYFNTGTLAQGTKVASYQWCVQIVGKLQELRPSAWLCTIYPSVQCLAIFRLP